MTIESDCMQQMGRPGPILPASAVKHNPGGLSKAWMTPRRNLGAAKQTQTWTTRRTRAPAGRTAFKRILHLQPQTRCRPPIHPLPFALNQTNGNMRFLHGYYPGSSVRWPPAPARWTTPRPNTVWNMPARAEPCRRRVAAAAGGHGRMAGGLLSERENPLRRV